MKINQRSARRRLAWELSRLTAQTLSENWLRLIFVALFFLIYIVCGLYLWLLDIAVFGG